MRHKVVVIGKFGAGEKVYDGQAIKTRIFASAIESLPDQCELMKINTFGWKKNPFKLFSQTISATNKCDDVIFMTDEGGIKVFPWLLLLANWKQRCRLHYVVVGGWLVHVLKRHKFISACLRRFDGIYVETRAMKKGLEELQFQNVHILLNCKPLVPLKEDELTINTETPHRLCIFSRIMREKGIDEAVSAVIAANEYYKKTVFTLDIYGQVDDRQENWFEELSATFPPEIRYCGVVPFDESVETIRPYFALLFPTKFFTEGIPGTIIDAYAAGVPVISSEWENFSDIVDHGITGIGYSFEEPQQLEDILIGVARDPMMIQDMKKNCLIKAQDYLPNNVLGAFWDKLFTKKGNV